jgi:enediyne biosynthesis protein E4
MRNTTYLRRLACLGLALATLAVGGPLWADGGVVYDDIALDPASGLAYSRTPSPDRLAIRNATVANSPYPAADIFRVRAEETPQKPYGAPGVVVFDHDGDGDLDLYVTNGPGTANSLFSSQLADSGELTFVDVGAASGVGAAAQDSTGACAGDIDNDGDRDLYVVATGMPNILFENQGDGTFADITAQAGVGGSGRHAVACSFGDVDGDGLLDVVVANTYDDWSHRTPTFSQGMTYHQMEHNYLFKNQGGNVFTDISASSGIESVSNMSGPGLSGGAFTWAIAMVDLDVDGDIDILSVDNQGGGPTAFSEERGWLRFYQNDGAGNFTEVTNAYGLDEWGGWMGSSYGDYNCDGYMDFFVTDLGGWIGAPKQDSRWFLGGPDGFTQPGISGMVQTPFGWGTVSVDYDNDADSDIVYHGSVDIFTLIIADNPGVLFTNGGSCSASFSYTPGVFQRDHQVRTVQGVASGDLNGDGFQDLVSVSNFDFARLRFLPFVGVFFPPQGSPFDAISGFEIGTSSAPNPGFQTYVFPTILPGSLSVEINSADNGNHWAETTLIGGTGVVGGAVANRDGIGAVVSFTPDGGPTSMQPVLGGASYASQSSLSIGFGLGAATEGTVDVLWPGGVRNRLDDVQHGEKIAFPEIPCSYDAAWGNKGQYVACVTQALNGAKAAGWISGAEKARFLASAKRAFDDEQ